MLPGRNQLRAWLARRLHVPEMLPALFRLRSQGFTPQCIFDVGAYRGDFTVDCLKVWPAAMVLCFEPQPKMEPILEALHVRLPNIQVYRTLLGATECDEVILHSAETASSVLPEYHTIHPQIRCRQTTVDQVVTERGDCPPDLLKLDVQGYELEVLKGAVSSLAQVSVIIVELNLLDLHRGVSLFGDVIGWLRDHDFVGYDVAGLTRRPLDNALWQIDMVFVRETSTLRTDKRWQQ